MAVAPRVSSPIATRDGARERVSFARIREVQTMPNLIDIQRRSFRWFLDEGLGEPKYSEEECRETDSTYAAPLRVRMRLTIKGEIGEIKEMDIFMGDFPMMTINGTFIINGAERVVVSQLVRSPGVY